MIRIAFATDARTVAMADDDRFAAAALRARGADVEPAQWDDPAVDWSRYDAMLPRSTWDYYRQPAAFHAWLRRAAMCTRVYNPLPALLWNAHKSYLGELAHAGVPSVPTEWIWRTTAGAIEAQVAALPWEDAVFKPAVSAGADGMLRVTRGDTTIAAAIREIVATRGGLLQPLLPELSERGETSLIFIDGVFTHAVRRPSAFAHGRELGGTGARVEPSVAERALAEQVMAQLPPDLLYARVDVAPSATFGPCLLELELLEPSLYFRMSEEGTARFADALLRRLRE